MASKKTREEIDTMFNSAREEISVNHDYLHYKNQDRYRVVDFALREDTQEIVVIYEALYEPFLGIRFTRPISEFVEKVKHEGTLVKRFSKVQDD